MSQSKRSTPLLYILTPNELAANGYQLPSYVELGDGPFIPGELPEELVEVVKSGRRANGAAPGEVVSTGVSVAPVSRPVEVDQLGRRRRGNVRGAEGWVETPEAKGQPQNGVYPVLAIDCEMVGSALQFCN
jgi:RNA exonuclease 1